MKLLFKLDVTETNKNTIGETNFKTHFSAVNKSTAWNTLKPFIKNATRTYIIPYIGVKFYDKIQTDYEAGTPDPIGDEVMDMIQDAIAYYTMYDAMPHINTLISDTGVQQNISANNSSQPSSLWSFKISRWSKLIQADKLMDQVMQYLEDNIEETYNQLWKADNLSEGSIFFKSSKDLDYYLNLKQNRRAFLALAPFLNKAEDDIKCILTHRQWDDLITKYKTDGTDDIEKGLIALIKAGVAELGYKKAIPRIRIFHNGEGFMIVSSIDGMDSFKNSAPDTTVKELMIAVTANTSAYLLEIKAYLYNNIDTFPLFFEDGYVDTTFNPVIDSGAGGIMIS